MKKYFYAHEGKSKGPFTKDELVEKINSKTLVWYEGLNEWKKASEIPELLSLFQSTPPPIPSHENSQPKKVEVILKKEKKEINAKSQIKFANEIKYNAFLVIISIALALIGFIYKSQTENGDYTNLLNSFKSYEKEMNELDRLYIFDDAEERQTRFSEWFDNNKIRRNELFEESKRLKVCQKEYSYSYSCDRRQTMNNLENRISYGYRIAKSFSFKVFFISIIVLIIGRYSIKSIKWVRKKSS